MQDRYVFHFGHGTATGDASMRELLGGKGANLAEMARIGLPVPPGFTVTTEACLNTLAGEGELPRQVRREVEQAIHDLAARQGRSWGAGDDPLLLVSVRSGAAVSMPGMMDTVLDVGLNDVTVEKLARESGDEHFAWDSYRRLLQMYRDVVMGVEHEHLETLLTRLRESQGVSQDNEISVDGLKGLVSAYHDVIESHTGRPMPTDPTDQLLHAVLAVFASWNTNRAVTYRASQGIPNDLGTAVNVQTMVYGNLCEDSGTGVAFTRNPSTGENRFYGEWLRNAQGEDVVAGIRTPQPLGRAEAEATGGESLEVGMAECHAGLLRVRDTLETHYREMQDLEFTIERGKLYILQTRTGKRSPGAELRIAVEMVEEGLIDKREAVRRMRPSSLEKLLHPRLAPDAQYDVLATGLGASPGAATGVICFTAETAEAQTKAGHDVILVRPETSPEDIQGILSAEGTLTARGGMTSHAAVVARGLGKPCVAGCSDLNIDLGTKTLRVGAETFEAGDVLTIDGGSGIVVAGEVPTVPAQVDETLETLLEWADGIRRLRVFANADNGPDAEVARGAGAQGIGLCRTEHMFFGPDRLPVVRRMILAANDAEEQAALAEILPMQQQDFEEIFRVMEGLPVIVRLLDPPLHEFLPHDDAELKALAKEIGIGVAALRKRCASLAEANPMLGHRGCRLGLTHPAIYGTQVRALLQAARVVRGEGLTVLPEVMVPLVAFRSELAEVRSIIEGTAATMGPARPEQEGEFRIGTMIELPRAALAAGELAEVGEFFSFGTNDLTQTTLGLSRDDSGRFLPHYVETGLIPEDPFVTIDSRVAELVRTATERGRAVRPDLAVGICGEHGGDPATIAICHEVGLDYVSCSPYRVPVARLAAAQATMDEEDARKRPALGYAGAPWAVPFRTQGSCY